MIELIKVSKYYPTRLGPHHVFRDVSLTLPKHINVGVIGPNGAGKSTLLRLLAGIDVPSSGEIIRQGRVSWPMGLTVGLQPQLTGRENARFACRIYGLDHSKTKQQLERICDISGVGKFFDLPVETYSAGMKQRVGFAITISLDFDYYIFDEISAGGDRSFAVMAQAMIRDRLANSRFILASHSLPEIRRLCQAAILIRNGSLTYYGKVADAIAAYSAKPDSPVEKDAAHEAKVTKLQQQFINLKLQERHLGRMHEKHAGDATKREDVARRLVNTRDFLQAATLELRSLHEEPPKPERWEALEADMLKGHKKGPGQQKLAAARRRLEQLRIDETRQQLNAENASSRAKRSDFETRLKATRKALAAAEKEYLALQEAEPPARPAKAGHPAHHSNP